jgi:hypothetical protein
MCRCGDGNWRRFAHDTFDLPEGETADPSASVGMTKGRVANFIWSCQIGWTEKKPQVLHPASLSG